MLGHLKNVYPTVPTLALSATITPNILDYIRVSLKLSAPLWIHRQPFDRPNLGYIVSPIRKPGFQDLAFLIPTVGSIADISKTMIFVDKIEDAIEYSLRETSVPGQVVRIFSSR